MYCIYIYICISSIHLYIYLYIYISRVKRADGRLTVEGGITIVWISSKKSKLLPLNPPPPLHHALALAFMSSTGIIFPPLPFSPRPSTSCQAPASSSPLSLSLPVPQHHVKHRHHLLAREGDVEPVGPAGAARIQGSQPEPVGHDDSPRALETARARLPCAVSFP